ncbi:MAG: CHASE domain-containing protein [Chthoniobacterales bacterium]
MPWSRDRLVRVAVATGILAFGLLFSFLAAREVKEAIEEQACAQFAFGCDQVTLKIRERLTAYALFLRGWQALCAASAKVEPDEWKTYFSTVQASDFVPGLEGVGYIPLIPAQRLPSFFAELRRTEPVKFSIRPPGQRSVYAPIIYIEPDTERNRRALGFDMLSEPVRRAALERAADTGDAVLSGKVILQQEDENDLQVGSIMVVPLYRSGVPADTVEQRQAGLVGWIYCADRMGDMMAGILSDWELYHGKLLVLRIFDTSSNSPDNLLFDSRPEREVGGASFFYQQRAVNFHDRQWHLIFTGDLAATGIRYMPAWTTLGAGMIITTLLFSMLLIIYRRSDDLELTEGLADQIHDLAFHDSLTQLSNRRLLHDRLEMAVASSKRTGAHAALMVLDLDNFKPLNDAHGHETGDLLLMEAAQRLRDCVREVDTVSRLGGDEFVVLLADLNQEEAVARDEAVAIAETICCALALPYQLVLNRPGLPKETIKHRCSASIGMTMFLGHDAEESKIINLADQAMYRAKKRGRNCVAVTWEDDRRNSLSLAEPSSSTA